MLCSRPYHTFGRQRSGRIHSIACFFAAAFFALTQTNAASAQQPQQRPLVFIPGILGSVLVNKSGQVVWGDVSSLTNLETLSIPDGPRDPDDALVAHSIIDKVVIFGPWKIKQYDELRTSLSSLGYKIGVNYFEFPYDWRESNYTTARKFAAFVNGNDLLRNRDFDILAHSMGGLVAEIYTKELDDRHQVRRAINMAVPFLGSVNTFSTLTDGWGRPENWIAGGLTTIRRFALSMPSFYELLPRYQYCCVLGRPDDQNRRPYDPLTADTWQYVEWVQGYYQTERQQARLRMALESASRLRDLAMKPYPASVTPFFIVGGSLDTRWQYYAVRGATTIDAFRFDKGDGTVPEGSAADGNLSRAFVSMAQHMSIFDDGAAVVALRRILSEGTPFPQNFNAKAYAATTLSRDIIPIQSAGITVEPYAAVPGEEVTVELRVTGEPGAAVDQLQVEAHYQDYRGQSILLEYQRILDSGSTQATIGRYRAVIREDRPGPVDVYFLVNGLPPLQDAFVVLKRK